MAERWYYWHESEVLGPYSGNQLAGLAAAGEILPTDTVWKDGVERGVPACKVEHLFRAAPAPTPAGPAAPLPVSEGTPPTTSPRAAAEPPPAVEQVAPAEATPAPSWDAARAAPAGRARAVAGKGAVIVGQDGITVKFRKKCTTCGYEDSSWKTIPITRGTTRVPFFCPKCRKQRQVEVHGHAG